MSQEMISIAIEINNFAKRHYDGESVSAYLKRVYGLSSVESDLLKRILEQVNSRDHENRRSA